MIVLQFVLSRKLAILASVALIVFALADANAQSTEQQFPTPLRIPDLEGTIMPRAVGDARHTTHFYTFEGSAGDLFFNIVTANLNADIDLFIAEGLRPLAKIVVYADRGETETGRVIYLRKPEKLLLRVQGKSPNDDPGRYRFKFAGTFVAAAADIAEAPALPKAVIVEEPTGKVTGLGELAGSTSPAEREKAVVPKDPTDNDPKPEQRTEEPLVKPPPRVVITEGVVRDPDSSTLPKERAPERPEVPSEVEKSEKLDPMAKFELVVIFRDGSRIRRPMTEVRRFQVDRGILMILNKNGSVSRYSMEDVEQVSIQ